MDDSFDITVIGGGIVGLAVAMTLAHSHPRKKLALLEKEDQLACHQTGHNSGVIHSGIYYRPGSFKASACVSGAKQLIRFCEEHGVPFEICGKVVVAVEPEEVPRLHELYRRGTANGVPGLRLIGPEEMRETEPHVTCLQGLHVPTTGIIDFRQVAQAYATEFQNKGGSIFVSHKVLSVEMGNDGIRLHTNKKTISSRSVINCGGLYADRLAELAGARPPCRIIPFRGEYYQINPQRSHLVRNLIYPVPDPRFPFLGVHFTRMIDGKTEAGPNAVLAWAREGYRKNDFVWSELSEVLKFPGFRRLAFRYWKPGLEEMIRSYSKSRFVQALQRLIPEIEREDLLPGGAGVRAQALGEDGALLDDFTILRQDRMVHVLNAPSPAATSSLSIASHILAKSSAFIRD